MFDRNEELKSRSIQKLNFILHESLTIVVSAKLKKFDIQQNLDEAKVDKRTCHDGDMSDNEGCLVYFIYK